MTAVSDANLCSGCESRDDGRSEGASRCQNDFAKWPILNQMTQGCGCLAEGIDALHDRLHRSIHNQRDDVAPGSGDRGR
jgi:hypothetical protein